MDKDFFSLTLPLVLVTGADGGIGSATCRVLLERGWRVAGVERSTGDSALTRDNKSHPHYRTIQMDLRSPTMVEEIQEALAGVKVLHGLVNVAGISLGNSIEALTDKDWEESFAVNVSAPMKLSRGLAPMLAESGAGSIVNIGSPVGITGARKPSYAASKSALQGLTMSLARNLGPKNVRVNLVLPGTTITPMTEDWPQEKREAIAEENFLGRLFEPEETARVIAFLLSGDSSCITGSVLDLTAGALWGH